MSDVYVYCVLLVFFFILCYLYRKRTPKTKKIPTPKLHKLLKRIPSHWDRNDFVICGSAALAFRGIRDVRDLDILVRPGLADKMRGDLNPVYSSSYSLDYHGIDVFTEPPRLKNVTFDDVLREADEFEGFKVQSARHTLAIKASVPEIRDKDRPDMVELAKIIAAEKPSVLLSTYRTLTRSHYM